ncbi:MAG TPA: SulP family inorganic anion transporter [Polyangium sp.]|nr:SulP family inorganic anion transporter [Polyangium sp.]
MPASSLTANSLLFRYVPALGALRSYRASDARHDIVAGLTVATVAVPQAMAYALIAGLPPEYGLYTAIVMTVVGALLDSSRQLINGPTNAISIALLSAIGAISDPQAKIQAAILLAFLVGSIQVIISLLRLGDLTRYISSSVIVGFTLGASVLLVLDQLKNLFGFKAIGGPHDHFLQRVYGSMTKGGPIHWPTLAIGCGTILLIILLIAIKKKLGWKLFPELLLAVVATAWVSYSFDVQAAGVAIIGNIPAKLPSFHVPNFSSEMIRSLSSSALAIALLGLLEAISMAKAIAAETHQKLDLNQQCLSEGVANVAGSMFSCFPGSGSLTRSAINQQAGASSQWSGVISAFAVAGIMLVFAPFAKFIPRAALAGILIVTAFRMMKFDTIARHARATRFDAVIVTVTALAAIVVSVEFCVLIGVFLSFLLVVPRIGTMHLTEFVVASEGHVHERLPHDGIVCPGILIFGLEGEMFFGSSTSLEEHFHVIESRIEPTTEVVILRLKRARNPDAVGLGILDAFIKRVRARNVHVLVCGVRPDFALVLDKTGIRQHLDAESIFLEQPVRQTSTMLALEYAHGLLTSRHVCPLRARRSSLDVVPQTELQHTLEFEV